MAVRCSFPSSMPFVSVLCIHFKNNCVLGLVFFFLFFFVMLLPLAGEAAGRSCSYIQVVWLHLKFSLFTLTAFICIQLSLIFWQLLNLFARSMKNFGQIPSGDPHTNTDTQALMELPQLAIWVCKWPGPPPCLSLRDQCKRTRERHLPTLSRLTLICNELSLRSLN